MRQTVNKNLGLDLMIALYAEGLEDRDIQVFAKSVDIIMVVKRLVDDKKVRARVKRRIAREAKGS